MNESQNIVKEARASFNHRLDKESGIVSFLAGIAGSEHGSEMARQRANGTIEVTKALKVSTRTTKAKGSEMHVSTGTREKITACPDRQPCLWLLGLCQALERLETQSGLPLGSLPLPSLKYSKRLADLVARWDAKLEADAKAEAEAKAKAKTNKATTKATTKAKK